MPTFAYKALKSDGKMAEGVLDAGSRPDALRQIEILGLRPVNVAERAGKAAKNGAKAGSTKGGDGSAEASSGFSFKFGGKKVSARELKNFTRLLSSLLA